MALPLSRTAERLYRARRISTTFGRIYLGIRANRFIARRLQPPDMKQRWSRFNRESAESIYRGAVDLRGLILKGCQFLGARADVLPPEYIEVLSRLQDRVPPRSIAVVRRAVEHELGREIDDVFASFSTRPVASASLAQVHEARLRDGRRVAVKVQYPEIEGLIRGDLANLRSLFRAVGLLERDVELMPLVNELATLVPRELNFLNEGRNAETIGAYFEHRDDVAVPRVHWEYTTRRLLVMDFIDGVKISDVARLRKLAIDPARVAQLLVEVYCEQILRRGFFHADPHPGNILVQRLPSGQPRLVLLDFGLAKELPPGFREALVAFASGALSHDAEAMAEALLEIGFEARDGRPEALSEIAGHLLEATAKLRSGGAPRHIGRELAERIRENPIVRVPGHVVLLARVLGLLAGVNRSLGARVDLMTAILPYVVARPS